MKEKAHTKANVVIAILFGIIITGFLGFLTNCFTSSVFYKKQGGFISFDRKSASFIMGIFGSILGGFGGLIITLIIRGISSDKIKSIIIGGITNTLIPVILFYTLDGDNTDIHSLGTLILGQAIAGGIAGLLVSSFFISLSDNSNTK